MKKDIFRFLFCLILVVLMSGCTFSKFTARELKGVDIVAEKPTWKIGNSWILRTWKTGLLVYYYILEVVDDDATLPDSKGEKCYKVVYKEYKSLPSPGFQPRYQHWEYYSKEGLEYLGKMGMGKDQKFEAPQGSQYIIVFPLKLGCGWTQLYYRKGMSQEEMSKISVIYKVEKLEELDGPAGKFQALKIHREYIVGGKVNKYTFIYLWYSPAAKNYIKREYHGYDRQGNPEEDIREVVSFKLK